MLRFQMDKTGRRVMRDVLCLMIAVVMCAVVCATAVEWTGSCCEASWRCGADSDADKYSCAGGSGTSGSGTGSSKASAGG